MSNDFEEADRVSKLSPTKQTLLEKRLESLKDSRSTRQVVTRRPDQNEYPLSFSQERMWFLNELLPNNPVYNRPVFLRITGKLEVEGIKRSLENVVKRHEVLRSTFPSIDGQPSQIIEKAHQIEFVFIDLSESLVDERRQHAKTELLEEARRPFSIEVGPLIRSKLVRLRQDEHFLVVVVHHIAFDGWSSQVLIEEISANYAHLIEGKAADLPELPIQYADYAYWQRKWFQEHIIDEQLTFWKRQLGHQIPEIILPTRNHRPAFPEYSGSQQTLLIPKSIWTSLKELSFQENVTMFTTLLAAFATLLFRYTHQEDLVVGTFTSNRRFPEVESLLGLFVETIVMRIDLSGNPTFREVGKRVHDNGLSFQNHQDLPFERIVEELQPERDLSRNPFFQVAFQLRNYPEAFINSSGIQIEEISLDYGVSQFDLTLDCIEEENGISCTFNYSTELFSQTTIERMTSHYLNILKCVAENSDRQIGLLPFMSADERHTILVRWNSTQTDYQLDKCIHELFETQVKKTPDNIAVFFEEHELTYAELNSRANQLAHYLRTLGVQPETLVGIYVERSIEMIIGILGILKAGGAYVPIDPAYPKQRVAYILEDTQAEVLLTQQRLIKSLPKNGTHLVCLDSDWNVIAQESRENLSNQIIPENLAYVIYTSGSTGRPKGGHDPTRVVIKPGACDV